MSSDTQFLNGRVGRTHVLQSYVHCKTYIRQNLSLDFQKKKRESPETELRYVESCIQDPVYNDWKANLLHAWSQDHTDDEGARKASSACISVRI